MAKHMSCMQTARGSIQAMPSFKRWLGLGKDSGKPPLGRCTDGSILHIYIYIQAASWAHKAIAAEGKQVSAFFWGGG